MGARNLLGEGETNAAAGRLGGIEGDKQVFGIGDARSAVLNVDDDGGVLVAPGNVDGFGLGGERSVDGVAQKVDKHLLELVGVGIQDDGWAWFKMDMQALLEENNAIEQRAEGDGPELWWGELGEEAIGLDEAVEGVGAALHNAEAAAEVAKGVVFAPHAVNAGKQTAGDGLDGGEGVGEFVAEHSNEALPGDLLFFLQR